MKILVIEDDLFLSEALAEILKKHKYIVDLARDGEFGYECALSATYDLIILDVMLPKKNGLELLQDLRRESIATPVLMLTAKGTIDDKVLGLDSGADDYLTKPFESKELLARVRVLCRRSQGHYNPDILALGNLSLNPAALEISNGNERFTLTPKEFQVLEMLSRNLGVIVAKNTFIEKIWGFESDAEDNQVEIYISFLRKKLQHLQANCEIKTVRGMGYVLKVNEAE